MSRLNYPTILAMVQNAFDDIYDYVTEDGIVSEELATENPLAYYLLIQLSEFYDDLSSDKENLNTFSGILTTIRDRLDLVEQSIENWEEYIDSGDTEY